MLCLSKPTASHRPAGPTLSGATMLQHQPALFAWVVGGGTARQPVREVSHAHTSGSSAKCGSAPHYS
eukprot:3162083-Alexandrium_andersonii.AAC.1